MKTPIRKTRCATYTRKSSEEGLEMEFNSLDASARLLGRLFPERLYIPAGETPEMEEATVC